MYFELFKKNNVKLMVERTGLMVSALRPRLPLFGLNSRVRLCRGLVCLMFSFLKGLCERGVKVIRGARDCFHLIVHLVNCFLFST